MWRYGFDTPHDYNDHECYCGGFTRQWQRNKGKCGICGDPWDSPTVSLPEKIAKCQSKSQNEKRELKFRISPISFVLKKVFKFLYNLYILIYSAKNKYQKLKISCLFFIGLTNENKNLRILIHTSVDIESLCKGNVSLSRNMIIQLHYIIIFLSMLLATLRLHTITYNSSLR